MISVDHVHRIACGLLRIHTPDCILPFYYDYRNSGVGGMCMTVVVIAMKMCYGLDGEQEFSGHPPGKNSLVKSPITISHD